MNGVQRAIFPGLMVGVLLILSITRLMGGPPAVIASTEEPSVEMVAGEAALEAEGPFTHVLPIIYNSDEEPDQAPAPEPEPENQPSEPEPARGCPVSADFPESVLRWCDLIDEYAGQHGLDPNLVAAVIVQESNGDPDAYSSSGAVGLMQVMPRDGKAAGFMCVNGPCFANRPSMHELYDPEFNVAYGTRMLAGLIQKRGSVRDGLFAYGPSNMGYYYADKVLGIYETRR